jgi:hypothetical protein
MVYHAYLDDSKDRGAKRVMVSAGFCANTRDWQDFTEDWQRVLDKHGLRYFKSSECHYVNGEFKKFRKGKYARPEEHQIANQIRAELQKVLASHPRIRAIGIAVQVEDYRKIASLPEAKSHLPIDPYRAALSSVMLETIKHAKELSRHPLVVFVHDDGDDFDGLCNCFREFRKKNRKTAKFTRTFIPMDDKGTPALQAADLIANHTAFLAGKRLDNKEVVAEMRSNISGLKIWEKNYMKGLLRHLLTKHKQPIPLALEAI